MKLTHKQKVKLARRMRNYQEATVRFRRGSHNGIPIFLSKAWSWRWKARHDKELKRENEKTAVRST